MSKHHYFHIFLFILFLVSATFWMVTQGIGITPDRYSIVLLLGTVFIHKTKKFLMDFVPFIFILISYDLIRGMADDLNTKVNYTLAINTTQWLFNGKIPTIELQRLLYSPGVLHWYDYGASIVYFLHFAVVLAFAFFLWFYNRRHFKEYVMALVLLSYGAGLTYLVFPTAPPWLASQSGYIPHVTKILNYVIAQFPDKLHLPTIYQVISANKVAAIPSMHSAYPFLMLLFGLRYFKSRGWFLLPYSLVMWFVVIYLGEHYVIDIAIGVLYAYLSYKLAIYIFKHHITWLNLVKKLL